jgi:type VI secretion system protein ImpH
VTRHGPRVSLAPLEQTPERFDLFAALRLIDAAHPDRPRLGEARRARDEPVRLGQPPYLFFPPGQIASFRRRRDSRLPPRLLTYAFGLLGPQGPLPLHVTAHALARLRHDRDTTLADFCDLLQHRLIALFYRAWATARPAVEHDRPARDRFARRVGAIAGMPTPAFLERSALPDRFTLYAAGLLAMQARPPEALARVVALFFKVPVRVRELVGGWLDIPPPQQTRLGASGGTSRLGIDAVAGARIFVRHNRFRIVLGPLTLDRFLRFLPVGPAMPQLRALVRHAAGLEHDWDVQLVLRREEVPAARLDGATRLGWTSWLTTRARRHDAGDLVLVGGS